MFLLAAICVLCAARKASGAENTIELPSGSVLRSRVLVVPRDWQRLFPDWSQTYIAYYPNGGIQGVFSYSRGKLNGTLVLLRLDGDLCLWAHYRRGQRDGAMHMWGANGQRLLYAEYRRGRKHGFTCFFRERRVCLVQEWVGDQLDGEYPAVRIGNVRVALSKRLVALALTGEVVARTIVPLAAPPPTTLRLAIDMLQDAQALARLEVDIWDKENEIKRKVVSWYREADERYRRGERTMYRAPVMRARARQRVQAMNNQNAQAVTNQWNAAMYRLRQSTGRVW